MEEFDDDDCSDLYADVVVQASSAISAMNRLTETRHVEDKIQDNATRREEVRDEFRGRSQKICEHTSECENGGGGGLTNFPLENGDVSRNESEDDLDSGSDDEYKRKNDENYESNRRDDRASAAEFAVVNRKRREGGSEFEEGEKRRGGIDAKEKCVNVRDRNSRKSLKYDSLSSKKNRVDEMACSAHKSCNKRDELFCKSDSEDNQSRHNNASGSCRPVSLDKRGSVQISDSVEDNHHEVSDYSSDGTSMETSKDTNRRKQSSNKVSPSAELESSESGWSQRGRGSSCSASPPRVALGDKYIGNSHNYSRHPSSSLDHELQYHPTKDSKSRNQRGINGYRYFDRQRGFTRKHSYQPTNSSDVPYLKNQWTNGDASRRNIKHGKQRAMASFRSNRNYMSYRAHSERYFTHSGGFLPDYCLGPAYWINQYPNIHPSFRYKQGWYDDLNMSERQTYLEKNINKMDYEAWGDDWHYNHRRHLGQANVKGSRMLSPKYSSAVNQRGTQFSYEEEDMQFRGRAKDDYLSQLHESDAYRRIGPTSGRNRDHLATIRGRNIAGQPSGNGKRRFGSSLNSSDRRNISGRPRSFPFYSPEEPYSRGRGQYPESSGPKSGVPERNMRCLWKEQHIENGRYGIDIATSDTIERYRYSEDHLVRRRHYQQYSDTNVMNESIKDVHDEDIFFRRHHQHSEVLHSREESRHQGDTIFHSEEPSYHFEKISRNNKADDRCANDHVEEHIDEREANRERTNMMREQDSSNQLDGYHNSIQPHSHAQMHPRYQDSIGLLVDVGRKCTMQSSRRTSEAGDDKYYKKFHSENAVLTNEEQVEISHSDKKQYDDESLDIEEGQIIGEETQDLVKRVPPSEDALQGQQPLDDEKIREIMVKMERRKTRFKEPVTTCKDSSAKDPLLDLNVESDMPKLERPSRKRRWSGA